MRRWLLPGLLLATLIGAWQIAASTGAIADALSLEHFLVPSPAEVASALWENRELLADNAWVTLREILIGIVCALVVGTAFAILMHRWRVLRDAAYPLIVASQTIPVIVLAPILVVWLGFGIGPKVAIIALICFFPITVNALDGLGTVPAEQRKLMRSLGAGRLRVLTILEAPTALPFVLSGAKIAAAVAVIGAVFGEWAGADDGLGHLMLVDNAQLEVPRLFAAMVWLSAMAIALFALLSMLERRIAWWGPSERRQREGGGAG